jgi:non-ribosomal peptide synthetase component F
LVIEPLFEADFMPCSFGFRPKKTARMALSTIVQGAWALVLSRYSGRREVVFGVTRAGRTSSPQDARAVGFYINTLLLRVPVDPQAALGPWLAGLRGRWLALRPVEHVPLQQAMEWGGLPPGMPPFESLLYRLPGGVHCRLWS